MSVRAFAFDLDETLVDCEPHHESATRAMLHALDVAPQAVAHHFKDVTGARTRDVVDGVRDGAGLAHSTDELLALRHAAFLTALDETPPVPLPGARDVLQACRARGPVALVSSGHREDVLATAEAAGLLDLFTTVVTGEDVLEPKPAPEAYRVAASRMQVAPAEMLVFEDSPRGVKAGRAAGARVVAVPNARSTPRERVAEADVVLRSLEEALPLDALLARLDAAT